MYGQHCEAAARGNYVIDTDSYRLTVSRILFIQSVGKIYGNIYPSSQLSNVIEAVSFWI